jgi:hypothetical protein
LSSTSRYRYFFFIELMGVCVVIEGQGDGLRCGVLDYLASFVDAGDEFEFVIASALYLPEDTS